MQKIVYYLINKIKKTIISQPSNNCSKPSKSSICIHIHVHTDLLVLLISLSVWLIYQCALVFHMLILWDWINSVIITNSMFCICWMLTFITINFGDLILILILWKLGDFYFVCALSKIIIFLIYLCKWASIGLIIIVRIYLMFIANIADIILLINLIRINNSIGIDNLIMIDNFIIVDCLILIDNLIRISRLIKIRSLIIISQRWIIDINWRMIIVMGIIMPIVIGVGLLDHWLQPTYLLLLWSFLLKIITLKGVTKLPALIYLN